MFIDPCYMGPCTVLMKGEVMLVDEWYDNVPQDFIRVYLCIRIAFSEMHLGLLRIGCVRP